MPSAASVAISVLALSATALAAPASPFRTAKRETTIDCDCTNLEPDGTGFCEYGDRLTLDDYTLYLQQYYPATDRYLLYSGGSVDQVKSFKEAGNTDYYYYNDLFDSDVSAHYLTAWPEMKDATTGGPCFRPDDADESSMSMSIVASGEIYVFGAIEYKKYPESYFSSKEVRNLHTSITAGTLNKITHLVGGAVAIDDVLATEDASGTFTFADGHADTETNASGTYGDCSASLDPPDCDIPAGDSDIHE